MAQTVDQCKEMTRVADEQTGLPGDRPPAALQHQVLAGQGLDPARPAGRRPFDPRPVAPRQPAAALQRQLEDAAAAGVKTERTMTPVKLDAEIVKARRALEQSYGSETEGWLKVLAQLEAQIADAQLDREDKARTRPVSRRSATRARRSKTPPATSSMMHAAGRVDPLAAVGPHRGGHDGRVRQPPARRGQHFRLGPLPGGTSRTRIRCGSWRPPTAPFSAADRDIEDHVCCIIEFPMPDYDEKDAKTHRKKISVQYASINGNGYLGYGELVYGTKGTLALEKEQDLKLLTGSGDEGDGRNAVKVTGGGGGPSLDTQSSGPARKAAGGGRGPGQPRLCRGIGTLGLVHPSSRAGEQAPLPSPRGHGRRHHRLDDQPGRADRPADPFQAGVVRGGKGRHARKGPRRSDR